MLTTFYRLYYAFFINKVLKYILSQNVRTGDIRWIHFVRADRSW